jgi:hypothetical protein
MSRSPAIRTEGVRHRRTSACRNRRQMSVRLSTGSDHEADVTAEWQRREFKVTHGHWKAVGPRGRQRPRCPGPEGAASPGGYRGNSDSRSTERRRDWRPRPGGSAGCRPPAPTVPIVPPRFATRAVPREVSSPDTAFSTTSWVEDQRSTRQRTFALPPGTPLHRLHARRDDLHGDRQIVQQMCQHRERHFIGRAVDRIAQHAERLARSQA